MDKNTQRIESFTISGLWLTMFGFVFISFIKELITGHYLIHLYVDSLVGIFAFYIVLHQLKKQFDLCDDKKPFIVQLVTLGFALIVGILAAHSPFDVTFLILVIGMITSKKIFMKNVK